MKMQDVGVMIVALLAVLWLGGWALGLVKHMVFSAIRLGILVVAAAVIIQLLVSRRG